jgi:hypothetical protein
MEQRVRVMMERIGIDDPNAARREIEKNDAAHTATMTQLGHADWQSPLHYDLVINSAHVPTAAGVAMIRRLLEDEAFAETDESRSRLFDLKLEAMVRSALKRDPGTRKLDTMFDITLKPGSGEVLMTGMVDNDDVSAHAEQVIRAIPEVERVRNELLIANRIRVGP